MKLMDSFVSSPTGAADFSTLFGGASSSSGKADLSSMLGGLSASAGPASGGIGSFLSAAATGAATGSALGPVGAGIGAGVAGLMSLFGGSGKPAGHEKPDIQAIAAANGMTEEEAGKVVAYQANTSPDNYDDLAKYLVRDNAYFLRLLDKYNQANPADIARVGSVSTAAAAQAAAQQQLITTATTTLGFGNTATGQKLMASLQALPSDQTVGTQGQTAGDIFNQILKGITDGALKGGSDAAAETDLGKSMKKSYIKDWAKENQLAAAGIVSFGIFGLVQLYRTTLGKGGKISL